MSKWYGMVGYGISEEVRPGIYVEKIVERPYYGDLSRTTNTNEAGSGANDDISIKNDLSIVSDAYAYQNFALMKYVTFMGARWKVRSVELAHPRLHLSIGGVYNGPTPEPSEDPGDNPGDQESVLPTPGDSQDGISVHSV